MKKYLGLLGMVACVAWIIILLITSMEIAIYSDFHWYQKEYEKCEVLSELDMEMNDVMKVTHEMMGYLRGSREDLVIYTTIDNIENQEFFNDKDKIHMKDVRNLFLGGLQLRRMSLITFCICIFLMAIQTKAWLSLFSRCYQKVLSVIVLVSLVLGLYAALDFNHFFTMFHKVAFTNDLWKFDPRYDYMIRMLPEKLFADMALRILIIFGISLIGCFILSIIYNKRNCKKNHTIGKDNG